LIVVQPFSTDFIEDAARIFCAYYSGLRTSTDLLPPQFEDTAVIGKMLAGIIRDNPAFVAIDGSRVTGYMTGYSGIPELKGNAHGVVVPVWAHAITESSRIERVYSELYSTISAEWISGKSYSQAVSYFNPDERLEQHLFGLGFGLLVIDGIRSVEPIDTSPYDQCEIRVATAEDLVDIGSLDSRLCNHLRSSPIFLDTSPVDESAISEHFIDGDRRTFLAVRGDEAVGGIRAVLKSGPGCELLNVEGSLGINFAYTEPTLRRGGIATQLLNEALRWSAAEGMTRCVVDFESANFTARGFWETHFQPICHSVIRRVDERIGMD